MSEGLLNFEVANGDTRRILEGDGAVSFGKSFSRRPMERD